MADKPKISIAGVLADLAAGKTREEIGEKYGLNKADTKRLFEHPQLKGRKTKVQKELAFEIVEDAPDAPTSNYGPKKKKEAAATQTGEEVKAEETKAEVKAEAPVKEEAPKEEAKVAPQKGVW